MCHFLGQSPGGSVSLQSRSLAGLLGTRDRIQQYTQNMPRLAAQSTNGDLA